MPAKQFLLCFNLSMFTGARAEARGEEGLPLHSPESEPDVQAEMPTGFRGTAPRELTPVTASAPAVLHPRDGAAVRGWGQSRVWVPGREKRDMPRVRASSNHLVV